MRKLIINADDFGLTQTCTEAIIGAFAEEKITSTTICANGNFFDNAVNSALANGFEKNIGIHLNITEGTPLTEKMRSERIFCDINGNYHGQIKRVKPLTRIQKEIVFNEFVNQILKVRKSGISVSHADSHHHIHTALNITPIAIAALKENSINKIRISRNIGQIKYFKKLLKDIYNIYLLSGKFISTDLFGSLEDVDTGLPNNNKSLEIMVHPDYDKANRLIDRIYYDEDGVPGGNVLNVKEIIINSYRLCSYNNLSEEN